MYTPRQSIAVSTKSCPYDGIPFLSALRPGLAACQKGLKVRFITAASLVHELIEAVDERRLQRFQKQLIPTASISDSVGIPKSVLI